MKKMLFACLLATMSLAGYAQRVNYNKSSKPLTTLERKVVGRHMLSLQWISWEYFGVCEIVKEGDGGLRCTGIQKSKENDDYLHIDGYIQIVSATHLIFTGSIEYKVYHLNGGEPYEKTGTFNFKATNGRKYWRAQEMEGADGVTDYVDIYFK